MRVGFAAGFRAPLLAAAIALAAHIQTGAQELEFSGAVEQAAGIAFPLTGGKAALFGNATSLDGSLDLAQGALSLKLAGRLSVLYGSRASNARTALTLDKDSRLGVLTWPAFDPDSYNPAIPDTTLFMTLSLTEAALSLSVGNLALEAGKTIVNWGLGKAFSPADFFSEIDYSGGSPSRLSSLVGRLSWFPGPVSRVEIAAEPFSSRGGTYAARVYGIIGDDFEFAFEGGYRQGLSPAPALALTAAALSFDLPMVTTYGEIYCDYALDGSGKLSLKGMAGAQSRVDALSILAEYGYDEVASSAHRIFLRAGLPLGDWVTLALPLMVDFSAASLGSGIILAVPDIGGIAVSLSTLISLSSAGAWSATADLSARASF